MFRFLKQIFVPKMMFFSCKVLDESSLKCDYMNNQDCKIRPEIININSNEPFHILTVFL